MTDLNGQIVPVSGFWPKLCKLDTDGVTVIVVDASTVRCDFPEACQRILPGALFLSFLLYVCLWVWLGLFRARGGVLNELCDTK